MNPGDAVTDLYHRADIHHGYGRAELLNLLFYNGYYIFASRCHLSYLLCHTVMSTSLPLPLRADQLPLQSRQLAAGAAVQQLAADPGDNSAENLRVNLGLE